MLRISTLATLTALVLAQEQPLVRVNTRLVEVDVVVRSKNAPVTGLTSADFTILDNGKARKIAVFSVRTPEMRAPKPVPLAAGAVANRVNPRGEEMSGLTIMLFDRLNTDPEDQMEARRQALLYLASVSEREHVALYSMSKTLRVIQDFTSDPERLRQAVAKSYAEGSLDLMAVTLTEDLPVTGDPITDAMIVNSAKETQDRAIRNRVDISAYSLELIAKHLAGLPGRKKLVWISSAFPAAYSDQRSRNGSKQIEIFRFDREIDKAARALNDANVAVYPIDPRNPWKGGFGAVGIDTMNLFAKATGGLAQYVLNDLAAAIRTAAHDDDVSYMLGFYPEDEKLDGAYHSLNVKVARKNVDLRHRKGYFASETKPPTVKERKISLDEAFASPLEATGIGITAAVRDRQFLDLRVNLNEVHFEPEKDKWVALIAVATQFPPKPRPNGTLEEIKITLTEKRLQEVLRDGYPITRPFASGAFGGNLRIVVQDRVTGEAGSVTVPIQKN